METETKTTSILELLADAGFDISEFTNRQRNVRSFNSVLKNSDIAVKIAPKGKVWTDTFQDGREFKYNFKISLGKLTSRNKLDSRYDFTVYNLLSLMGKFLQREDIRSVVYSETEEPCKCSKCNGAGVIPEFYWYADGVCFDCLGIGSVGKLLVQNVNKTVKITGRKFVGQFHVGEDYADFPQGIENLRAVNFIGHQTAEVYLSKKDGYFYIHQPICRANSWYCIPEEEFEKFKKEYNKLFRKEIL